MGMIDSEVVLSTAQAITANGDTASTNVYDTGGANGQGDAGQTQENLWVDVVCNTAFTSGTSATLQVVLSDSADNSSWADVSLGPVIATGSLPTAGQVLMQLQPPPGMRRYWRITYRVGVGTMTAGKVDAYVSNTIQRNVARPSGFSVS